MPLIKDVRRRRLAFEQRAAQQLTGAPAPAGAGLSIQVTDLRGLEDLPTIYVNRELLLRVHGRLVDGIQAGESDWPEQTQFSRFHFRSNDSAITNLADYAPSIESREQPIERYVQDKWAEYAAEDIAATRRRKDRGS